MISLSTQCESKGGRSPTEDSHGGVAKFFRLRLASYAASYISFADLYPNILLG